MGMLDNDVQRRMLSPILARNMGIFQSRMGQHRVQQLRVYQTNEATARAELSADYAIQAYSQRGLKDAEGRPVGLIQYAANADTAVDEIRKAGQLMGYAPDSSSTPRIGSASPTRRRPRCSTSPRKMPAARSSRLSAARTSSS
jgi:hypothetical protein